MTLPEGLTSGHVNITIEIDGEHKLPWELRPWTEAELAALTHIEQQSGAEIVAWLEQMGGWEDQGIEDGAVWVDEQRHTQRNLPEW